MTLKTPPAVSRSGHCGATARCRSPRHSTACGTQSRSEEKGSVRGFRGLAGRRRNSEGTCYTARGASAAILTGRALRNVCYKRARRRASMPQGVRLANTREDHTRCGRRIGPLSPPSCRPAELQRRPHHHHRHGPLPRWGPVCVSDDLTRRRALEGDYATSQCWLVSHRQEAHTAAPRQMAPNRTVDGSCVHACCWARTALRFGLVAMVAVGALRGQVQAYRRMRARTITSSATPSP